MLNTSAARVLSLFLAIFSSLLHAEKMKSLSVCDLLDHVDVYHQKTVEIHASLVAGPHADVLVDDRCGAQGGIRLVLTEDLSRDPKVISMIRRVMAHQARADVDVVGTFDKTRTDTTAGSFLLHAVL